MTWQTILGIIAVVLLIVGLFFAIKNITPKVEHTDFLHETDAKRRRKNGSNS